MMIAMILTTLSLVIPCEFDPASLDKTGTSRWKLTSANKKALENQGFSERHPFDTERAGLEATQKTPWNPPFLNKPTQKAAHGLFPTPISSPSSTLGTICPMP